MTIVAGSRIGPYEVTALIGEGGMGRVYRAIDTNLKRAVAIKVLPESVADNPARLARFQREAEVLAALNHPNIAGIYGLERSSGATALVMELVEGPTLAERIAQGPLSIEETLVIAKQIVEALEAAHERGFVHRDLKPANIKVREDGTVKVLDFGLAKALDTAPTSSDISHSPTMIGPALMTSNGAVLGTAAYMSPEQARGRSVDKRADIWAFGCVVFEALSAHPAFAAETVPDTLVAILSTEPKWHLLPDAMPAAMRRLLRRCLQKDLRRRLHDIGDVRLELEDAGDEPTVAANLTEKATVTGRHVEFQRLTDFSGLKECPAVSPDGKMVAFVALMGGRRQILIRLLAGGAPLQVTRNDTDHEHPRWAPDSSTLIYYTPSARPGEGTIWEVSALGGPPRRVAAAMRGGDISHDGERIALFQSSERSVELVVVARNGSRKERVISLSPEFVYTWPRWSPDDRSIAFQHMNVADRFDVGLDVVDVSGGHRQEVTRSEWLRGFSWLPDGSGVVYSSSRGSSVLYPPVFNVRIVGRDGRGDRQVTFGDLSYVEPDMHKGKLLVSRIRGQSDVWRFPLGGSAAENTRNAVRITRQTGQAQTPSISPDGTEVVYLSDNGGHGNLWIARTDGSSVRQVTFERDPDVVLGVPMWSPTGEWIVFIVVPRGVSTLWAIRPDGSGLHQIVARGRGGACWSGDGRCVYYTSDQDGIPCIAKVPIDGGSPSVVRSHASNTAVTRDDRTLYYMQKPASDVLNFVGELEICGAPVAGGSSSVMARVANERTPLGRQDLLQPFLSPDSQWLAAPLMDGATSNIWILPTSGGPMRAVTDFGDRPIMIARSVSWSADSQSLYAAVAEVESDVVLWDGLIA
jgi:Tol biopolymer transport system component